MRSWVTQGQLLNPRHPSSLLLQTCEDHFDQRRMQAEWFAELEGHAFETFGELLPKPLEVAADVLAGGEEERQHQHPPCPGLDAVRGPLGDCGLGQFEVGDLDDRVRPAVRNDLRQADQIGVGLGPAAAVRDQQDGG